MRIYFLGICGTAMGNVACLLKEMGDTVAGSDRGIYPPMSDTLAAAGIPVWPEFDVEAMEAWNPDLVVVGNAMTRGNTVVEHLLETRSRRFVSLPELVRERLLASRHSVVVAGTHGKTTAAAMTATLLERLGAGPGWLIGGVPRSLESGCAAGGAEAPFVIEGDEYDSAFFDKRSKFIHYAPRTLVLNNLEFDHADIFRDLEDVRRSFSHLLKLVPGGGAVLYNGDDAELAKLLPVRWARCHRVGFGEGNALRIRDYEEGRGGSRFDLVWEGTPLGSIEWGLGGAFNARNGAMAVLAAALATGRADPRGVEVGLLNGFEGVRRRQEIRYSGSGVRVVEDFGHHPTAVGQVLESMRSRYPGSRVWACFEPRSNTSATSVMQAEWAGALAGAERVWIGPIFREADLPPAIRLDRERLVRELEADGVSAMATPTYAAMEEAVLSALAEGGAEDRTVIFFSNGSFGRALDHLVAALEAGEDVRGV